MLALNLAPLNTNGGRAMTLSPTRARVPARRSLHNLLFEDLLPEAFGLSAAEGWNPRVDIKETETEFVVTADVPGVDPRDIDITMEKGALTIKGERNVEHEEDSNGYHRVERSYGSFQRRFAFPDNVDVEGIKARGKNGVLSISIPKTAQSQARKIDIHAED